MKRAIALLLILAFVSPMLFAAINVASSEATSVDEMTAEEKEKLRLSLGYEPYSESEFPSWLHKLRRVEVITLGATALTYPILNLALGGVTFSEDSTKDFLAKFGISAGAGLVIALIDLIIGEFVHEATNDL